jgi:hypothetical protein
MCVQNIGVEDGDDYVNAKGVRHSKGAGGFSGGDGLVAGRHPRGS